MTDQKIQFTRTYKITWPHRFDSDNRIEFNRFLFDHGIRSASRYQSDVDEWRYKPTDVETKTTIYKVIMRGKQCLEFDSERTVDNVIAQLEEAFPDDSITKKEETTTSIEYGVEIGLQPWLIVDGMRNKVGDWTPYNILGGNEDDPDSDILASVEFSGSNWGDTTLEFNFTYSPNGKPSPSEIESILVDETLDFTANIESKIERGLREVCYWDDETILNREVYCATDSRVDTKVECKPTVMQGIQARKAELGEEEE